jgi:predicted dehydrogenase
MRSGKPLRVAIVGCGAVAELVHLPAIASLSGIALEVLVDKNPARASRLAQQSGARATSDDYRAIIGGADAAIVAVPHHLHAPVAIDLLRGGVHVLVEKPMALSIGECDAMIRAARDSATVLAVGLQRRFHDSLRFAKQAIDAGLLGVLTGVEVREGSAYNWKVETDAMLRPPAGGVLADIGVHVLDLLAWWFGDCEVVSYRDDAMGGVEADCEIRVRLSGDVEAAIELSRTRNMPNTCVLTGTRGTLEVGTKTDSSVRLTIAAQDVTLTGKPLETGSTPPATLADLFRREFEDFVDAIENGHDPVVTGREGRKSVGLMEACYARREMLEYPWEAPARSDAPQAVKA